MKAYGLKNLIATYSQWAANASNVTEVE
jgi:hypothetical protein